MTSKVINGAIVCLKGGTKLTKKDEEILSEFVVLLRKEAKERKRREGKVGGKNGRR